MTRRLTALCAAALMALFARSGFAGAPAPDADSIHRDAIVIDGHNDVTSWIVDAGFDLGMDGADPRKHSAERWWVLRSFFSLPPGDELRTHTDLRRLQAGGVDAQFFSIFVHPDQFSEPGAAKARAHQMIDAVVEQVQRHPEALQLATSVSDIRRAAAEGRVAALMGLEGGDAIENELENLREFHARGVRYMTLTWSRTHDWADSSNDEARHGGLNDFGRDVVREMNRLGVMVDVSHVSDDTFWDVIEVTRVPVIASHSSARAIVDVPRNMSDEMLRAVAENQGVVMVNFGGTFIDPNKAGAWKLVWDAVQHFGSSRTPLSRLLDHIEHIAKVAGARHVGLGSDFDGTLFFPEGLEDVSGFPAITRGLLERGFTETEVRGILGENLLRVFRAAERAAEAR